MHYSAPLRMVLSNETGLRAPVEAAWGGGGGSVRMLTVRLEGQPGKKAAGGVGLSREDGSCGPRGFMSQWREGQRLSCSRPREGEGSGQGSCCDPAWARDLALQFPVRCEGSVRSPGLHLSPWKGVCPCEGGVRIWGYWLLL